MNGPLSLEASKKFIELIDDYIRDLRRFYTQLSAAAAVDEIDQWQIKGFPYPEGKIPAKPDMYYVFHGDDPGRLEITIGQQKMDIIFGHYQRIDGFDVEHISNYLNVHAGEYVGIFETVSVEQLFNQAVNNGFIKRLFIDEGDYNYYKIPAVNN